MKLPIGCFCSENAYLKLMTISKDGVLQFCLAIVNVPYCNNNIKINH